MFNEPTGSVRFRLTNQQGWFVFGMMLLLMAASTFAQEAAEGVRLPKPLKEDQFVAVRTNSPFTRTLSIADTYTLRAVTKINDKPLATLFNNDTGKTIIVSADGGKDSKGLTLVDVFDASQLDGVAARVSFAGEEADIGYRQSQLAPKSKGGSSGGKSGSSSSGEKRGPSKEDIDRYKSLGESKQKQLQEYIKQIAKKYPSISREERGNMIRGAMIKLGDGRSISDSDKK